MRAFGSCFLPVCLFACLTAAGQSAVVPGKNLPVVDAKYKDEALIWEHFDETIHMREDGTGDRTLHIVVRLQSEGAARQFSVLSVPYASAYETGTIDYIRVHKPDGSTVETPVSDAIEMPAAVTREAPLYSDLKEKQLPVRSVAAADVLEYQFHTVRTRAEAPGQFWGSDHFLVEGGVVLSQTLTLEIPAGKYVQVWAPNHPARPTSQDGELTYKWTSQQLRPTPKPKDAGAADVDRIKDPDEDADGRKLPSVAWTTFHSWAEVGDWYRALAHDRLQPTPAIQARAAELTKDAKTPDEQVRALYDFVSTKTRYVGIDFGVGRYQPHTPDEVMDHQYGDCKDKDTLLESLLRAKGFTTAPALIGVNIAPVAEVPSPATFNHVITTVELPEAGGKTSRIWLDTTPEVAPYRVLVPAIRDEQALVVPDSSPASLQRTPADPPFPYYEKFNATGTLDKDGLLKTHMEMTLRSDSELGYRVLLQRAAPSQWDEAMQSVSNAIGFGGTVTNTNLKQTDPAGPVHITYDYSRASFADWEHMRILPLFPYLEITTIDKEKAPEHDIDQGAPRTLEATTRIQLPEGYRAELPDAMHVKRDYATFDKTYKLDKGELIIERKAVILKKKVPKADWKDYVAYTKAIGMEDGESYIVLIPPTPAFKAQPVEKKADPTTGKTTTTVQLAPPAASIAAPPTGDVAEADIPALMQDAQKRLMARDVTGAEAILLRVKKVHPDYPYLMSMLAGVASMNHNLDEAIEDLKAELKNHPDANVSVVYMLASDYMGKKRTEDAIALLKTYSNRNDDWITTTLAQLQVQSGDEAGAVETLQAAINAKPDNRSLQTQLAAALHRMHRDTEAAAAAKQAMDGSDDPGILNDAAYELGETRLDLPLAEKNSRRAVELLEAATTRISLQEANTRAFQQTELLVAAWDTLGWILFQEGKPAAAEPYIAAAWFHRPDLVIGNHLAQIREALGKPSEALTIDDLALASTSNASDKIAKAEVTDNAERLRKAGAKSSAGNATQTLQDMRSFKVERADGLKGWGTFRVQIAAGGVHDSELVNGPETMRPMIAKLNKLKLTGAVPPGSSAQLLRDGVLSCTSSGKDCEFVLMPRSGLQQEGVQ
jgi:transglutaminase-like putative cysteine protease/predicted Zn-dependent protease